MESSMSVVDIHERLRSEAIAAAMALYDATGAASILLVVPGSDPPLYVAARPVDKLRRALDLTASGTQEADAPAEPVDPHEALVQWAAGGKARAGHASPSDS